MAALTPLRLPNLSHESKIATAVMNQATPELKLLLTRMPKKSLRYIRKGLDRELRNMEASRNLFQDSSPKVKGAAPRTIHANNVTAERACVFCSGIHRAAGSTVYLTYQTRIDRIRHLGLCVRCLHKGHTVAQCTVRSVKCYACGGAHYRYLCPQDQRPDRVQDAVINCIVSLPPSRPSVHWINAVIAPVDRSPLLNAVGRLLLMTLFLGVTTADTRVKIRTLIDPGADVCLVSNRLCRLASLPLKTTALRRLIVGGGAVVADIDLTADVPIAPLAGHEVKRLRAYVVDTIIQPIAHVIGHHTRRILDNNSIIANDCITLEEARSAPIDLLVGMDALSNFFTDVWVELTKHLSVHKSIVGGV